MSRPYVSVEKDGTVWSDEGLPCPYCKHVQQDDLHDIQGALDAEGGETECQKCGEEFSFSTYVSFAYTSRRRAVASEVKKDV